VGISSVAVQLRPLLSKLQAAGLAAAIAEDIGWDRDWLNDGVKGFLIVADSDPQAKRLFATYPSEDQRVSG
jgi:hypothetical protein